MYEPNFAELRTMRVASGKNSIATSVAAWETSDESTAMRIFMILHIPGDSFTNHDAGGIWSKLGFESTGVGTESRMSTHSSFTLPALSYSYGALEPVISARIMELHHGTHHAAYVKKANQLTEDLRSLSPDQDPSALVRSLAFNVSGHQLHSLFWEGMRPPGGHDPSRETLHDLEQFFGSVDLLKARMTSAVENLSGSGWAALVWEPLSRRLVVSQIHDHQHDQIANSTPILVIDGWEHAYYLQYEAGKAKWASAFWSVCDWDGLGGRLHRLAFPETFVEV
jgi:superoxide dismutase, Fe-Mn family